jgi:hypothetical protein
MPSLRDDLRKIVEQIGAKVGKPTARTDAIGIIDRDGREICLWVPTSPTACNEHECEQLERLMRSSAFDGLIVAIPHGISNEQRQLIETWDFAYPVRMITTEEPSSSSADLAEQPDEYESKTNESLDALLKRLRPHLLDLTLRNTLLNFRAGGQRSVPIIDEVPRLVLRLIVRQRVRMTLEAATNPKNIEDDAQQKQIEISFNQDSPRIDFTDPAEEEGQESPDEPSTGKEEARHVDRELQTSLGEEKLSTRLARIFNEHQTYIESTGTNILHLALGFVTWYESPDSTKQRHAPLILIPVRMVREKIEVPAEKNEKGGNAPGLVFRYQYTLEHTGDDVVGNECFIRKCREDFGIAIPDLSFPDGEDVRCQAYFAAVQSAIEQLRTDPRWRVSSEIYLGFFSFAKIQLWHDLAPGTWGAQKNGLLERILSPTANVDDGPIIEKQDQAEDLQRRPDVPLVHEADGSQTSVISEALAGKDLLVQGPPGTGKSQTITNLIAAAITAGKKVLFVSEKAAALEVVHRKLSDVELGDFCLELHSHRSHIAEVMKDIATRVNRRRPTKARHAGLVQTASGHRDYLNAYAEQIGVLVGPYGETIGDVMWKAREAHARTKGSQPSSPFRTPTCGVTDDETVTKPEFIERGRSVLETCARLLMEQVPQSSKAWETWRPERLVVEVVEDLIIAVQKARTSAIEWLATVQSSSITDAASTRVDSWPSIIELANTLPDLPIGFIGSLARTTSSNRQHAVDLCDLIKQIRKYRGNHAPVASVIPESTDTTQLQSAIHALTINGYNNYRQAELLQLHDSCLALHEDYERLILLLQPIVDAIGLPLPLTWLHLALVRDLATFFRSSSASLFEARLLTGTARRAIRSGAERARVLITSRNELVKVLELGDVEDDSVLREMRQIFRARPKKIFALIGLGPLARARKKLARWVKNDGPTDDVGRADLIDRMLKWRSANDSFNNDGELKQSLGEVFEGTDSPWDSLEAASAYAQRIVDVHGAKLTGTVLEVGGWKKLSDASLQEFDAVFRQWHDGANIEAKSNRALSQQMAPQSTIATAAEVLKHMEEAASPILAILAAAAGTSVASFTISAFTPIIAEINMIQDLTRKIKDHAGQAVLGDAFASDKTDVDVIQRTLAWFSFVHSSAAPDSIKQWLLHESGDQRVEKLRAVAAATQHRIEEFTSACKLLKDYGRLLARSPFSIETFQGGLAELISSLDACVAQRDQLVPWSKWCTLLDQCEALGLSAIVTSTEAGEMVPGQMIDAFLADVYGRVTRRVLKDLSNLACFDRAHHETRLQDFRALDTQLLLSAREAVAEAVMGNEAPMGRTGKHVPDLTDMQLIRHCMTLARAPRMSLRRLIERAQGALLSLKPCWMMSPMSVAHFLPTIRGMFDLVVMDEASQIRPVEAFGALLRSKQAVIVGDPKQMPPSRFFDAMASSDDPEEEQLTASASQSILDLCSSFRSKRLQWHYRSQHESLIQFSNEAYYDNELIIFPAKRLPDTDLGITFRHVPDGVFRTGRNYQEAEIIVDEIIAHARRQAGLPIEKRVSLGVVVMNADQRSLIDDLLTKKTSSDRAVDAAITAITEIPEALFIKNLENVQGDERDRIIIGFTYGKDPSSGRVPMRFGPISQAGGERRLNVLFSRAKRSVLAISSMRAEEIIPQPTSAQGIKDLKRYLEFIQTGVHRSMGEDAGLDPDSEFEISVARIVRRLGFIPRFQVGVAKFRIDIGVMHASRPGEYLLGIECDGATYHSSRCARDRDRLRQEIIESRGWRLHRIWSTAWYQDRESEGARLEKVLLQSIKSAEMANT